LQRSKEAVTDPKRTLRDVPGVEAQQRHIRFLGKAAGGKSSLSKEIESRYRRNSLMLRVCKDKYG
jgi:hypothetical protein